MAAFRNVKSPKSPIRADDSEIDHLLESVKRKLEKLATQTARDELSELVNSDSKLDLPERKEMTKEKLSKIGAIPKLGFCRLENFRLMRVLGVGSYGKVFLVRMKSHRILPDSLYPNRFPQISKGSEPENNKEFWPEGLSKNSDLCSKYWLPRMTNSMEESVFQHYFAMKVVTKQVVAQHKNDIGHLQTELRALRQINHPFLVCFYLLLKSKCQISLFEIVFKFNFAVQFVKVRVAL
jgi:hypothetical protein